MKYQTYLFYFRVVLGLLFIHSILFLLLTTATAFGKSTKYFENTLVHMFGSDCNSKCRQEIIKSETDYAVVLILKLISTEFFGEKKMQED